MRIVFDARGVQQWSDGLSTYVRQTLTHLLRLDTTNEYVVLLHRGFHDELSRSGLLDRPGVQAIVTPIPFMGASQYVRIPSLVRRIPQTTVYHYPHFDMPLLAHPRSIATIYDVNHISLTGYFNSLRPLKRLYSFGTTSATLAAARHIITISHATKQALLKRFPWRSPSSIRVIYLGLNQRFMERPTEERVAAFRSKFQLGQDRYILYVGTDRPHKNLERLLGAFSSLRRQARIPHKLLLVGSAKGNGALSRLVASHALQDAVTSLGYLSEDEVPLAYHVSDVFAFCSLSEGFGLPLLEAMAARVPIVTSNIGATAEVASESALLVDPFSSEAIADGLYQLVADRQLSQRLVEQGTRRVQAFLWETAARQTLEVYRQVAGEPPCHSS